MLRYEAQSSAAPEIAWALIARPGLWHRWAPQLRGAWGLGTPEVALGARGAARLLGVLPVPAHIVAKETGRSWAWRVGPAVRMDHAVQPRAGGGCSVAVSISAPAALERALGITYGPVVSLLLSRLARVAEEHAAAGGGDVLP